MIFRSKIASKSSCTALDASERPQEAPRGLLDRSWGPSGAPKKSLGPSWAVLGKFPAHFSGPRPGQPPFLFEKRPPPLRNRVPYLGYPQGVRIALGPAPGGKKTLVPPKSVLGEFTAHFSASRGPQEAPPGAPRGPQEAHFGAPGRGLVADADVLVNRRFLVRKRRFLRPWGASGGAILAPK